MGLELESRCVTLPTRDGVSAALEPRCFRPKNTPEKQQYDHLPITTHARFFVCSLLLLQGTAGRGGD